MDFVQYLMSLCGISVVHQSEWANHQTNKREHRTVIFRPPDRARSRADRLFHPHPHPSIPHATVTRISLLVHCPTKIASKAWRFHTKIHSSRVWVIIPPSIIINHHLATILSYIIGRHQSPFLCFGIGQLEGLREKKWKGRNCMIDWLIVIPWGPFALGGFLEVGRARMGIDRSIDWMCSG